MDFAYLGREEDPQKTMAVLVAMARMSKMIMSAAAPRKTTDTYMTQRVGVLLNRFEVCVDGRTAYVRNRGKKATTLGIGIHEARRKKVGESTWEVDVAVGGWHSSGCHGQVIRIDRWRCQLCLEDQDCPSQATQRKMGPEDDRLGTSPSHHGEVGDVDGTQALGNREGRTIDAQACVRIRMTLRSADTPGCRSILKGSRRQGHSEARRQRLQKALEGTVRLEWARTSENEFYEEVPRIEDKKWKLAEGQRMMEFYEFSGQKMR